MDYQKVYHLEQYLFEDVANRYRLTHTISAFDFFCIVIWKANRAKSKIAKKLLEKGFDTLELAVETLCREIAEAENPKAQLKVLIKDWKFSLPMASAILTVLDEENFTVYDVRVCDQLGSFHSTRNRTFEKLWIEYQQYVSSVRQAAPAQLTLRDKDRWLWGKSFSEQLQREVAAKFRNMRDTDHDYI